MQRQIQTRRKHNKQADDYNCGWITWTTLDLLPVGGCAVTSCRLEDTHVRFHDCQPALLPFKYLT